MALTDFIRASDDDGSNYPTTAGTMPCSLVKDTRMRLLPLWLATVLLTFISAAQAQTSPQALQFAEGHELALTLCSVCHIAAPDQGGAPVMSNPGPPFRDIANNPAITPAALRTFLLTAHANTVPPFTMPNPQLSDQQINAMIAYILGMRAQR
jgi:mono/diheme cytochrome c family protein